MRIMWIICLSLCAAHAYYKADKAGYVDELFEAALNRQAEPGQVPGFGQGELPVAVAEHRPDDEAYVVGVRD